jgi:hypothetical protein
VRLALLRLDYLRRSRRLARVIALPATDDTPSLSVETDEGLQPRLQFSAVTV